MLQNTRVLIVDDNATNCQIFEKMLSHWRMRPSTVEGAEAALRVWRQAAAAGVPFSLMLVDCHMPEIDGFMLIEQMREVKDIAMPSTIMLTSGGQRGDALRCKELGISAYLIKPVLQSDLLATLLRVVGTVSEPGRRTSFVTRQTLREGRTPLRVLLAEDNLVNQRLATRLLEKQGHVVVVAGDGARAIEALEKDNFELILMDVQMPVMRGIEATGQIREREKITGSKIPIIALTAHAMAGDRQRFLAAGMDAYLSKPLQVQELLDAIESVLSSTVPASGVV